LIEFVNFLHNLNHRKASRPSVIDLFGETSVAEDTDFDVAKGFQNYPVSSDSERETFDPNDHRKLPAEVVDVVDVDVESESIVGSSSGSEYEMPKKAKKRPPSAALKGKKKAAPQSQVKVATKKATSKKPLQKVTVEIENQEKDGCPVKLRGKQGVRAGRKKSAVGRKPRKVLHQGELTPEAMMDDHYHVPLAARLEPTADMLASIMDEGYVGFTAADYEGTDPFDVHEQPVPYKLMLPEEHVQVWNVRYQMEERGGLPPLCWWGGDYSTEPLPPHPYSGKFCSNWRTRTSHPKFGQDAPSAYFGAIYPYEVLDQGGHGNKCLPSQMSCL
jgi:hypothetical protein